ncbi:hypothetical protein [Neobacillus sp. YIM B06451]|uniref:hypothetical protein n=1 Tax=Neobacillus sp. YIM B06451 TaxID=3070994 RepID=UPI00292CCACE|nr:hypothetical protein [Neobacillus sp. YIM B06451]
MKTRKRWVFGIVIMVVLIFLAFTNPNEKDYYNFIENEYGKSPEDRLYFSELERINFFVFSTYTPIFITEHGITHLGIMGKFIQISDGQFDYPLWLRLFN